MKSIITVLCLASVICLWAAGDVFTFKRGLPGWTKNTRTVSFDPNVKISEEGSLKLTGQSSVSKTIRLEPDSEYEISVYIKAENVSGGKYKGALLRLTDGKKYFAVTGDPKNLPRQGSFDWTKCTRTLKSSFFGKSEIKVMPVLTCEGTAWFDELQIVKKEKPTSTALVAQVQTAAAPDMSDFSFKRGLPGWQKNTRTISFDPNVKISEEGSLKLTGQSSVSKTIRLEPDSEYEISVYIKAENVSGGKYKGALLRLTDGKKYFAVTGDPKNLPRQGSFDWTKCTRTLKSSFFGKSEIKVMPVLTCEGTAWFDELQIEKKKITPQGENVFRKQYSKTVAQIALIPEGVFGFFDPDQEVSFRVLVESSAKNLEYQLTVKDESGHEVYRIPRKKLEETFRIPGQKIGYYTLDADIFADGKKAYFIQSAFAVNVPVKKLDPFFQFSYGSFPEMIRGLKRIGGGSVVLKNDRLQYPSSMKNVSAEELAEQFVKEQKLFLDDPDFELAIGVGATLQSSFRSKEDFKAGWPLMSDVMLKHLLDYVKHVHKLTRNRVREWTISCEIPSNATGGSKKTLCSTWTEAMFNLMVRARMVSRALKAADPKIKIVVGGNNRQEFTDTVERIVMGDLVNDFDEYCIDGYTGNWNMILGQHSIPELKLMDFYKAASTLSVSLGKGKVIRNDETGYAINYGARFDRGLAIEQAYLTARTIIITRYAPVSRFELHAPAQKRIWEVFRKDDSVCLTTCWKPFRLGKDKIFYHIPLPGGAMYATVTAELSYAKSLAEVKNGNIYSYLFQKPDGSVLITLWNIAEEQRFICDFPADASAVNMYGRAIPVKNLTIGKAPVYITVKMPPAQAVELMKKAVLSNTPEFRCRASDEQIYIRSYAKTTKVCALQLPGQPEIKVKLRPWKMNVIKAKATGKGKLVAPDGREYPVPLKKVDYHTISRIKSRPVFDGSGKWLAGLPSGFLKYPENIRPAEALQPERRYFKTSLNPDGHNISAQFWTAYDEEYFYLAVKVDDPVHQQRQTAGGLWKDDSIQLVLSHEGIDRSTAGGKPVSEYNFGLAQTSHGTMLVKYLGKDKGIKDYPAKVTRSGNTTFYEVAIPWKAIGGKAKRFGFVVANNNWQTVAFAPYRLEFTEGICGGADDTKLKVLKYAE